MQNGSGWRASLVGASVAALFLSGLVEPAGAVKRSGKKSIEVVQPRSAGPPVLAVVSLSKQRVTIYDANGPIMRAPVSSGRKGRETPAGIYSIIQKEVEHHSNLYDDAYMPFMQRITWSGIALHGGRLPGYPASHGCVRMPMGFAKRLFGLSKIGMRVVVARDDPAPVEFGHRLLSGLNPALISAGERAAGAPLNSGALALSKPAQSLQSIAAIKRAEAEAAERRAEAAGLDVMKKTLEAARISAALRLAESAKSRLEVQVTTAQTALESAESPGVIQLAQEARANALARLAILEVRLTAATFAAQQMPDLARARQEARAAEAEKRVALEAAAEAARRAMPVSIFISRKTQRLYLRQSFQPIFDAPITIKDPEQPVGTHIFIALDYIKEGADMRWSVVSMAPKTDRGRALSTQPDRAGYASAELTAKPANKPNTVLDRIVIPREVLDHLSGIVSPGSSLIVSDEDMSSETGTETDFVILMSGEPQGGIKGRRMSGKGR